MAKHCEHCKQSYPDHLETCPHCAAAVEVVEAADAGEDVVLLEAVEPVAAPVEEEAVDLGQPVAAAGGDSISGIGKAGPASDDSALAWASLAEGVEPEPGEPEPVDIDSPSDADLRHHAPPVEEPAEPEVVELSEAETAELPAAAAEELLVAPAEGSDSAINLVVVDNLPTIEDSSSDLQPEKPTAASTETSAVDLGSKDEIASRAIDSETWSPAHPGDGASDVSLGDLHREHPPVQASDLNLLPEAMESGTSEAYLGSSAEHDIEEELAQADEDSGELLPHHTTDSSGIDLHMTNIADESVSGLDIMADINSSQSEFTSGLENPDAPPQRPPSVRDIVEEVESGVDLMNPAGRADVEDDDMVSLEPDRGSGSQESAVDLGAPIPSGGTGPDSGMDLAEAAAASGMDLESTADQEAMDEGAPGEEEASGEMDGEALEEGDGRPVRVQGRGSAAAAGWFIGTVVTALAAVGVYFSGLLPEKVVYRQGPAGPGQVLPSPAAEPASLEGARAQLFDGHYDKARSMFEELEKNGAAAAPEMRAAQGETLWLDSLHQLAQQNKPLNKDELVKLDTVAKAREHLIEAAKANNADAFFWLGQLQEWTEGPDKARATYEVALKQFPDQKRFEVAIDRIDSQTPKKPAGMSWRSPTTPAEAHWLALAMIALQAGGGNPQPPAGAGNPAPAAGGGQPAADPATEEAGYSFWKAIKEAQGGNYEKALDQLKTASKAHETHRFSRLRKAQNPLTDPTEEIFLTACKEIEQLWKDRERLRKAGYTDLTFLDKVGDERKAIATLTAKLTEEKYDDKDLAKGLDQLIVDKKKAETDRDGLKKKIDAVVTALKEAGAADADPLKAVAELEGARKKAEKDVAEVVAALKEAGAKEADALKAVGEVVGSRKLSEKKIADIVASLKAAGVAEADAMKGLQQLVAARDTANGALDDLLKRLREHKYLPEGASRADVAKGLDHVFGDVDQPVVAALTQVLSDLGAMGGKTGGAFAVNLNLAAKLTATEAELGFARAERDRRHSPEQMMQLWVALLRDRPSKQLAALAMADADRVLQNQKDPMPAAECVKALAQRSEGKYAEARAALHKLVGEKATPNDAWAPVAGRALAELIDPSVHFVPAVERLRAEKKYDAAEKEIEQALQVFPKDEFARQHASLLALRSLVRLDQVRSKAQGTLAAEQVKDSAQDAAAALAGGEEVESKYAQGRLAEEQGDLAAAEVSYRDAVKAFDEGNAGSELKASDAFRKTHPACDPTGSRYRAALGRVLLEAAQPAPAAPPKEEPKGGAGSKTAAPALAGELVADARPAAGIAEPQTTFVAWGGCCPPVYGVPSVVAQKAGGGAAPDAEMPDEQDPRAIEARKRFTEALVLAEKLVAAGDPRGYFLKAEALARMGTKWSEAIAALEEGSGKALTPEESANFVFVLSHHPCFQRRDGLKPPDPLVAAEHFAAGLRYYFAGRYAEAEKNFGDAVYYDDQDARYVYFLGLARYVQPGKRAMGLEDFRQGGRLEAQHHPSSAAVSVALERVQGPMRRVLNNIRDKAIADATGKEP